MSAIEVPGIVVPDSFHGVLCIETSDQTINTGAGQPVTFNDADIYDTDGYHDTGSNTSRLVVPSGLAGYYRVWAALRPADDASTYFQAFIAKNGTQINYTEDIGLSSGGGGYMRLWPDVTLPLAVADYVEVLVAHGSGSSKLLRNSFQTAQFGMYLVGT